MPRPLPLSLCCPEYDWAPGYKFGLFTHPTSRLWVPLEADTFGVHSVQDGACERMAFQGLVLHGPHEFSLHSGYSTTTAFNESLSLPDGRLLQTKQGARSILPATIEFEDENLYSVYTNLSIEQEGRGRYVLHQISIESVEAYLQPLGRMEVVELRGLYRCLTHEIGKRDVPNCRECL